MVTLPLHHLMTLTGGLGPWETLVLCSDLLVDCMPLSVWFLTLTPHMNVSDLLESDGSGRFVQNAVNLTFSNVYSWACHFVLGA